jgi:hypothetical protein
MIRSKLIPLTLAFATLAPGAALAAQDSPTADAAIRKGIRDFVRLETDGAGKASKLKVTCRPVEKVGQTRPCAGTFNVVVDGQTASYRLTKKARTFRISPGAIEYRVSAVATKRVAGLPARTDLLGFLQ